MRTIVWLLLLVPALGVVHDVTVRGAWIREAPPNARVLAGYATVANASTLERRIVGASSPAFGRVELHTMTHEGGVMRMRPLESLVLPAGGEAKLAPGSDHLMLMEPAKPVRVGDRIAVTFELDDGSNVQSEFEVRAGD